LEFIWKELIRLSSEKYFNCDVSLFGFWGINVVRRSGCQEVRGSAHETRTWIVKAMSRNLIPVDQYENLILKIDFCIALINGFIKSIGKTHST
jgi:hypothetical protein